MTRVATAGEHRPSLGARRLIGQGAGAAFVTLTGEIDWWCPGRFDAAPALWSLLDRDGSCARWLGAELASWEARPAGATTRTTVRIGGRSVELWDGLLAVEAGLDVLVRLVRSPHGSVELTHELQLGGFDAPVEAWAGGPATRSGAYRVIGGDRHDVSGPVLRTTLTARPGVWRGIAVVAGFRSTAAFEASLVERMAAAAARDRDVARHVRLPRDHAERAIDAMQVLRTLTDRDTGAPVAAATTSLPEAPGGTRQFDYRYTWLRDSAYAVSTAALLGHVEASARYLEFLERIVDRYGEKLTPLTTTTGDPAPPERQIDGVRGWAGSLPVVVGNEASEQRQIDAVSTILEAIWVHVRNGGRPRAGTWRLVDHFADLVMCAPREPSSGIWEFRDERPLVTEELARWIGLHHALRLRRILRPWVRKPEWVRALAESRELVDAALDPETGMLPQSFEGELVPDAATLLAVTNGFFDRRDPRLERLVRATIAALEEGAFLRRYPSSVGDDDGFEGREACFIPASWWAVSALCAIGDLEAAARRADAMCAVLPPVQPEEWDVERGEGLGNAPLLWSNTEMARALFNLHSLRVRRRFGVAGMWLWHAVRFLRQLYRPRRERVLG